MRILNPDVLINKVQKVSKILESTSPECTLFTTENKFGINTAARRLMGLDGGDRVIMLDMNIGVNDPNELRDINERFFLAENLIDAKMNKGKLSKKGDFSYSGCWGAILYNDPAITEIPVRKLVDKEIVIRTKNGKLNSHTSTKKVIFDVKLYTQEDENGNIQDVFDIGAGTPQPIYLLENYREFPHTVETKDDEEAIDSMED